MWSAVHVSAFWAQNLPAELTVHQNEHLKPHSLQQSSTLNGATLIFKSTLKTTATFLMMFIRVVHFTLPFISALGYFFVSFFERMKLTDDFKKKAFYFLENAAEGCWKSGKKYVERDWCVVNSCHLYVLICVYLFYGFVSIGCKILFKLNLIFQWSNYSCHINCCWFFKLLSKVMGNIALFLFNHFIDCVRLLVYYTILSRNPGTY